MKQNGKKAESLHNSHLYWSSGESVESGKPIWNTKKDTSELFESLSNTTRLPFRISWETKEIFLLFWWWADL